MLFSKKHLTSLLFMLLLPISSFALTAQEIAQKVTYRDDGQSQSSTMTMIMIDKHGNQRVRSMKSFSMDKGADALSALYFLSPSDVKNTAFLTYDYSDASKDDDQWLYLPALKKSKRIASSDKSGSFMGSDFSYSDMTSRNIQDYTYEIKKESQVDGHKVWILETTPKTDAIVDETGYVKSYMFVRQDNFVVVQALHLLKEKGKKKYMQVKALENIDGIWIATSIEMKTTQEKEVLHTTILEQKEILLNSKSGVKESFFSVRNIEKGL